MSLVKQALHKVYFRSRLFRSLTRSLLHDNRMPPDFSRNVSVRVEQVGPVHDDEALLLFALARVLRPQTIVEFGFRRGHSAFNFLQAGVPGGRVFSYDISEGAEKIAQRCFGHFDSFRFIRKSQTDFSPSDIDNRKIDLCFLDASHELSLNLRTLELIRPHLADAAIVAIHDTGVWHRKFFQQHHFAFAYSEHGRETGQWIDAERYQPALAERLFVNTLAGALPGALASFICTAPIHCAME